MFAIGALTVGSRPPQQQHSALLVGGLILIVLIGLRLDVGCDWFSYAEMFRRSQDADFWTAIQYTDPGYAALNWIAAQMGLSIWAVNLVCAIIFTAGLISFCRWQPNSSLAMLVAIPYLAIVVAMGYTRQSAALGFVLFALTKYQRGSLFGVASYLVLAVLFHKAAILVVPIFGLAYSRNIVLSVILFGVLGFVLYRALVSHSVSTLMSGYIKENYSSSGAMVRVMMNVAPALLFLGFRNRFKLTRESYRIWMIFSLTSLAALVLLFYSRASTAIDRSALFLIPLQVFVLSRVPSTLSSRGNQSMLLTSAVIAYSLVVEMVWLNLGQFARCWIPYHNYLWS